MRIDRFIQSGTEADDKAALNICGVLVHANPRKMDKVGQALAAMPGVEIHQQSKDGRMIVTVEDAAGMWAGDIIKSIQEVEGVLTAALVYHHFDESHLSRESFS